MSARSEKGLFTEAWSNSQVLAHLDSAGAGVLGMAESSEVSDQSSDKKFTRQKPKTGQDGEVLPQPTESKYQRKLRLRAEAAQNED